MIDEIDDIEETEPEPGTVTMWRKDKGYQEFPEDMIEKLAANGWRVTDGDPNG